MNLVTVVMIALGLAMDAFAVSVASGVTLKKERLYNALKMALAFGVFQMMMPILGWLSGMRLREIISGIDHFVAFALLALVGSKMIYESAKIGGLDRVTSPFALKTLLVLSVATSIDALAIGLSFAFLKIAILMPVAIIGVITFILSFIGIFIGERFGHFFERKIEAVGGVILILIGLKILVEHLL